MEVSIRDATASDSEAISDVLREAFPGKPAWKIDDLAERLTAGR